MCGFYLQVNREDSLELSKERINLIESRLSNRGSDSTNSFYIKDKTFNYFMNHSRLIISGDKEMANNLFMILIIFFYLMGRYITIKNFQ